MASQGIVLELQRDCLDQQVSVSTILRKAKVIASKLDLDDLRSWIDSELEGYKCSLEELPSHRKGKGQPKFNNPYNGWCPIMTEDDWFGQMVRTVFMVQSVSEMEELIANNGSTLLMYYNPSVQSAMQEQLPMPMECALHFSKTQVLSALDYVRNRTLDWTLELEKRGIVGQGLTFGHSQKEEAQMVTNHIYGSNIGVLGSVAGDANSSHFFNGSKVNRDKLSGFLDQAIPASAGLDPETRKDVQPILSELQSHISGQAEPSKVKGLLSSLRAILEGASGNLVASAILGLLSGHGG